MKIDKKSSESLNKAKNSPAIRRSEVIKKLQILSGKEVLESILDDPDPRELITGFPPQDLFWVIKKIGESESLEILSMASEDQWQYLLDLEVWQKERLDDAGISSWIKMLHLADRKRLARWLYRDGQWISFYYVYRYLHVVLWDEETGSDIPEGYTTYDGVFYFKVLSEEYEDTIKDILKELAKEEPEKLQALLLGVSGVLPSELEEEMYRMRNVRLAEYGFLPREEAFQAYSPLRVEELLTGNDREYGTTFEKSKNDFLPIAPVFYAGAENYLTSVISITVDSDLRDKLCLEFAGLCNQILSANGLSDVNFERLSETCKKAAGYLNLVMEKLCGGDLKRAEKLLRENSLISIFRVGFGMLIDLKRETEKWLKECWFFNKGLEFTFWGDEWGGTLLALLQNIPHVYGGQVSPEGNRNFETLSDFDKTKGILLTLRALDKLLEKLSDMEGPEELITGDKDLTFENLFFTFWGRKILNLEISFKGLPFNKIKKIFDYLRKDEKTPPFRMEGFEKRFIEDLKQYIPHSDIELEKATVDALTKMWDGFKEEYAWVPCEKFDSRFVRFFRIIPD